MFSVEWNKDFENIDLYDDIGQLKSEEILNKFGHPDVIWASPDCFPEGYLVWTSTGYKDIKDVKCGDFVLTHKGNYKKVYRTIKKNDYQFNKIKIAGSEEILVTPNHPFYVRKKKRINTHKDGKSLVYTELLDPEWINAENLSTEYRVGIPVNQNSIIPEWNGCIYSTANGYGITNSWIENTLNKYLDNKDFWWLIGRYFGDGYITKDSINSKQKNDIDICCAYDEIDEIRNVVDRLGITYRTREKETTFSFVFYSKEFREFLLQFGVGALNKRITPEILNLPVDLLKSFLDGYISADGYWNNSSSNPSCSITTVSKELAYGIQQCILKAYGRYASMVIRDNQNDIILGRKVNVHKAYCLSFYKNYNEKRMQYIIENGIAWVNVKNNEKQKSKQRSIYTLSVEDDESYTVNNIAVHNCTSFSIAAISHHRRKNPETGNLDPVSDYAKFCDKTDQHVLSLIKELNPTFYFIENPRGGMRKMTWMKDLPRYTVTYCRYGDVRMKPTDIWTNHPDPKFLPMCKNGDPCHVSAPRGSRTGTQGLKGSVERSKIPQKLCEHIVDICEEYIK